jgi:hypothetical protein
MGERLRETLERGARGCGDAESETKSSRRPPAHGEAYAAAQAAAEKAAEEARLVTATLSRALGKARSGNGRGRQGRHEGLEGNRAVVGDGREEKRSDQPWFALPASPTNGREGET